MENKKPMVTVKANGEIIEFNDAIHHNVSSEFDFWARIRILFGKKYHIDVTIYVKRDNMVITGTKTDAWVSPIFDSKGKSVASEIERRK